MAVIVTLSGDGLNYNKEATVVQAAQIIGFLNSTEPQGAGSTSLPNDVVMLAEPVRPRSSAREHLLETGARTNAQKILVLADYITKRDNEAVFPINDVKSAFSKAGEPVPKNFSRDLREAVRLGYISEDDAQSGHFFITNKGVTALESGFDNFETKTQPSRRKRTTNAAKNTVVSEAIKQLDYSDLLDGYPNYHALGSKTDKAIWILVFAKTSKLEALTGKEIEYISQQLSDHIPNGQIAAAMRTPLAKGYASKVAGKYRVLHDGEQYLKGKKEQSESET